MVFNSDTNLFSSPEEGILMGTEIEINPSSALYGSTTVFNHSPTVSGNIHTGAKWIVCSVGCYRAIMGKQIPGKEDNSYRYHPGTIKRISRKEARFGLSWRRATCSKAAVGSSLTRACTYVTVPKIEFKPAPAASFPTTALRAITVGRCLNNSGYLGFGTTT